jgi:hypothetical protein
MSPLFGDKEDGQDGIAAMNAEIERVSSLPLQRLAAEVMIKGFGPDGPGGPGKPGTLEGPMAQSTSDRTSILEIATAFTPAYRARAVGPELQLRLGNVIGEGLQVLEHSSLVRVQWHSNVGGLDYIATRLGRAAVERDAVDRILDGGSL